MAAIDGAGLDEDAEDASPLDEFGLTAIEFVGAIRFVCLPTRGMVDFGLSMMSHSADKYSDKSPHCARCNDAHSFLTRLPLSGLTKDASQAAPAANAETLRRSHCAFKKAVLVFTLTVASTTCDQLTVRGHN